MYIFIHSFIHIRSIKADRTQLLCTALTVSVTQAIEEPFVTAVKEALGDRFTPTMDLIYHKTIKFILTTLTTGFMYYDDTEANDNSRRSSAVGSPSPSTAN